MTRYRDSFKNNKSKNIDLNNPQDRLLSTKKESDFLSEAESERYVKAYYKYKSRYIPEIDYRDPKTFAFFGSAEKYYEDSINNVYNSYPYDGSKAEKVEWSLSASYLDIYLLEHEYPKEVGSIDFVRTSITNSTGYVTVQTPKYIKFFGGPQKNTIYSSSKKRESNIKIDGTTGNTIEFWLKKDASSYLATNKREIILDINSSNTSTSDSNFGRLTVELRSHNTKTNLSPFYLTYRSGSTGTALPASSATAYGVRLGTSGKVTCNSVADGKWHHYAITAKTDGSNTIYKFYVDGKLDSTTTENYTIGPVTTFLSGTIGASTRNGAAANMGQGQLSGSLDELRVWKTARSAKEIGRFWYSPVHGGTDNDHTNADLGLYYKFNEGVTSKADNDKVILDYSGRINNGEIINWDASMRSLDSAITLSENVPEKDYQEVGDPIINPDNNKIATLRNLLKERGRSHDASNLSSLRNSVPQYFTDTDTTLFIDLLQIMSSAFDDIFIKIKNLPKIKGYAHQDFFSEKGSYRKSQDNGFLLGCENIFLEEFTGHHAKPWVSSILEHFGMVSADIFQDATMFERFFNRTEEVTFEHDLEEVKRLILSNIHKNLIHILKTKGTESSFRNLIRCFGVDDEIIKLNAYGENEVYELVTKPVYTTVKQKSLSFEGQNYQATLFPKAEAGDAFAKGYITGSSPKPLTMEGNFIFPKYNVDTSVVMEQASLFGVHSVKDDAGSTGTLTIRMNTPSPATGFFQVNMVQDDIFDGQLITLEDASGATKTFLFDAYNTKGATGTVDGSGNIIIQISGNEFMEKSYIATQIKNAVDGSGLDIISTIIDDEYGEPDAKVLFTQGTPGVAGNTSIVHNVYITSASAIGDFEGGGGGGGPAADNASLQVKVIKRRPEEPDAYFELSSTTGVISPISSSYFPNVYDNQHWNIAVRVGTKEGIDFNIKSPSQYFIELSGYNYDLDIPQNSFNVSASISVDAYNKFSQQNKAIFLGAHRTNFSGSVLVPTDVRALGFNAWQDILTDEELKEHAQNSKVFGRKKPQSISNFDTGANILSLDSMLWRWQFEAHTSSSSDGEMIIQDMSAAQASYSTSDKYTGKAIGLLNSSTAISQEFLPGVEYFGPDSAYSSDRVKIKNSELEKFKADSRPVTYNFAFEKSMYQVISREMVNFFAGIVGFGNLIGEPVNKYRRKYKLLEKIRNRFFLRVNNEPDIEKFTEYYKWIDSSVTKFLSQLIPASSFLSGDIKDVVESHVLERNKYEHKAPTMEFKDPADRTFPIFGVNELLYDWEHGHPPNLFTEAINSKAIRFKLEGDDNGGTVEIPADNSLSFGGTLNSAGVDEPFSISTWVYVNDIATDAGTIIGKIDPTMIYSAAFPFNFTFNGQGEYGLKHESGSLKMNLIASPIFNGTHNFSLENGIFFENTSNTLASKTWHFITVTYDGSKNASGLKVYKDGTEIPNQAAIKKNNYSGMQNFSLPTTIGGAYRPARTSTFEDFIADTIIYNKELTSAEITEVYNSGKVKDMSTFSAYNNIISWWKMGDDFDDVGLDGIRDYKGTNHGTLTTDARIVDSSGLDSDMITHIRPWRENRDNSTNCLWVNERAEVSDDRKAIKRITHTEVGGSTYAARRLAKPYRLTADNVVNKKAGFNRDANKNIELYKVINEGMSIVLKKDGLTIQPPCKDIIDPSKKKMIAGKTDVTGTDGYFDGDSDLILPFNLVSSSAGTDLPGLIPGLKIANNHQEFEVTGEASLKGPFGETHIGGMPHNKVPFGMDDSHAVSVLEIGNFAALRQGATLSFKALDGSTITVTAHDTQTTTDDRDNPTFKIENSNHSTAANLETCLKENSKIISVSRAGQKVTIAMPSGLHGKSVTSLSDTGNPHEVVVMTGTDFKANRSRPEAYALSGIKSDTLTISSVPVDMPKSIFYRDVSATRFATIRNIKSKTSSLSLGNYVKDYEAVMTTGRSSNNNYFIDNADSFVDSFATVTFTNVTHLEPGNSIRFNSDIEGVTIVAQAHDTSTTTQDTNSPLFKIEELNVDTAANLARCLNANSRVKAVATGNVVKISMPKSMHGQKITLIDPAPKSMSATDFTTGYIVEPDLPGLTSFEVPDRGKTEHVIVNRFSAPGSPEASGMFTMDAESAEYSVYNTINYRNLMVRSTLNRLHSERSDQFGLRSGSLTQGSVHKTNRNTLKSPSDPGNAFKGLYSMSGVQFAGEDDPNSNPIGGQQAKTEYVTINYLFNNSGSAGGDNPGLRQGPMSFFTWIKIPPTHTFSEANITYPSGLSNGGAGTGRSTWHSIFSVTSPLSELGQDRTRLGRLRNALFFGVAGYPNLTTNDSATEFVTGSTSRIPAGHLVLDASDAESFHDWVDTGTKIDDDKWHHVGFTYSHDDDFFNIYVDGQLVKQKTYGGTGSQRWMSDSGVLQAVLAAAWYKRIDMDGTYFHNFMHATYSNVTTWDDQLSAGEVSELYNNGVPDNPNNHSAAAAPSKLRSWYKLDRVDELEDLSDHAGHSYPDLDAQFGPAIINSGGGRYVDTKNALTVLNEESEFDSFFIQRPIPSNDLGYSWIAASSNDDVHSFLRKNENFPYQHTMSPVTGTLRSEQSIDFLASSEGSYGNVVDFVGLNTVVGKSLNTSTNTIDDEIQKIISFDLEDTGEVPAGWVENQSNENQPPGQYVRENSEDPTQKILAFTGYWDQHIDVTELNLPATNEEGNLTTSKYFRWAEYTDQGFQTPLKISFEYILGSDRPGLSQNFGLTNKPEQDDKLYLQYKVGTGGTYQTLLTLGDTPNDTGTHQSLPSDTFHTALAHIGPQSDKVYFRWVAGTNNFLTADHYGIRNIIVYNAADLNSRINNRQGPYGWPTWKQIRGYEHPISRYERLNSKLSIVVGKQGNLITPFPPTFQQYEWSTNPNLANLSSISLPSDQITEKMTEVYNEVPVTNRFNPITITFHDSTAQELNADPISQPRAEAYWTNDETSLAALGRSSLIGGVFRTNLGGRLASLKVTIGNEESKFSNYSLMDRLSIEDIRVPLTAQKILEELGSEPLHEEVLMTEINYIETLYPREVNTFTKESRIRETFDFFAWRDTRADRTLILTGSVVNNVGDELNLGLLPPQEGSAFRFDGSSGFVEVKHNNVLSPVGINISDIATRDFSGENSRATASDSSLLTMASAEPEDVAVQLFDNSQEYFQVPGGATSPLQFSRRLTENLGVKRFQGGANYESVAVVSDQLTLLNNYNNPVNELKFNGSNSKIELGQNSNLSFVALTYDTTDNAHVEFGHEGSGVDQQFEVPDEKLHSFVEPFGTPSLQTVRHFTGKTETNRNYLHVSTPSSPGKEYIYSMVKQDYPDTECDYSIMFWIKPDDITSFGAVNGYTRRVIVQKRNSSSSSDSRNYEWMVAQHNRKIYLYTRCGLTASPIYYPMVDDILDNQSGISAPWQCILITYKHVGDRRHATQQVRIKDDGYAIDDLAFRVRCNLHSTDHIKVQFDSTKFENESTYDSNNRVLNIGTKSFLTGDNTVSDDIAEIVKDKMNSIVTSSHKDFDVTRSSNYLTFTMHAIGPVDSPDPNSSNNPIIFTDDFQDTYRSSDIQILSLSDGSHPQVRYYKNGELHETVSAPTIVPEIEGTGQDHSYKYRRMVPTSGYNGESLMVGRNASNSSDSWRGYLSNLLLFKHDGASRSNGTTIVKHNSFGLSGFDAGRLYNDGFLFDYESNIRHMDIVGWWRLNGQLSSAVTNGNDGGSLSDGGGTNSVSAFNSFAADDALYFKEKQLKAFVISFWCKPVSVQVDGSNRIIISKRHEWMVYKKNKRLYLRLYDSKFTNLYRTAHYFVDFESDELLTANTWQHVSIEVYIPELDGSGPRIVVNFQKNNELEDRSSSWYRPSDHLTNKATPSEDGSGNVLGLPSMRPMNTGNKVYIGQSQNSDMETITGGTNRAATACYHGGLREVAIWAANEYPSPHGFYGAQTPQFEGWDEQDKNLLYGLPLENGFTPWAAPYDLRRHPLAENLISWWTMRGPQNGSHVGTVIDQIRGRNAVPQSNINLVAAGTSGNLSPRKYEDKSFSIVVWVKPTDLSEVSSIVAKLNTSVTQKRQEWDLTLQTNGKVRLHVVDHFPRTNRDHTAFRGHYFDSTAALTQDEYTHVVAIYRASTQDFKYYINGAVSGTGKTTYASANATLSPNEYVSMAPTPTPVTIGCRITGTTQTGAKTTDQHFKGSLHRMAIFRDKELSDSEVEELYNSGNAWEIKQASTYSDMLSYFKLNSLSPSDVKGNTAVAESVNLDTFQSNNSTAPGVLNNSYEVDKSFTIAFYYLKESTTQSGRILGKWGTLDDSREYKIEQDGRGLKLYLADTTGTDNQAVVTMFDAPHVLSDSTSEWEHIIVTYYGGDTRKAAFYVNGSTLNSTGGFGSYEGDYFEMQTSGVAFRLGDTYNDPATAVDSAAFKISNLVIFTDSFTPQEAAELYNSGIVFDYNTHSLSNFIRLWWTLDDATGTNVNDSSGLGHHGTANGNLTLHSNSGLIKESFEDKPFTISFWARQSRSAADDAIISKADIFGTMARFSDVGEWAVYQSSAGNIVLALIDPAGPSAVVQNRQYEWSSILSTTAWKFITIVYDPTATNEVVLYHGTHTTNSLDGTAVVPSSITGGTNYSSMRPSTYVTRIGNTPSSAGGGSASRAFAGRLSNMALYDAALNTAQVTEIYNTGYPRDLRPLSSFSDAVAYWKLDDPNAANAIDQSSNSLDGVRNGPTQLAAANSDLDKKQMEDLPFTFGLWVRKKNFTNINYLISKYGNPGSLEYLTSISTDGKLEVTLIGETPLGAAAINLFEFEDIFDPSGDIGKWVHLCITYDPVNTTMKVYKNSVFKSSSTGQTVGQTPDAVYRRMLDTNGQFAIGAPVGALNPFTDALFSHVVIFRDCVLSSTEVQELYNNKQTWDYRTHTQASKIVAWWKLNEEATTGTVTFADSSVNSHTLTASGNAITGASAADAPGERLQNFEYKTKSITLSAWIRLERTTKTGQIIATKYMAQNTTDPARKDYSLFVMKQTPDDDPSTASHLRFEFYDSDETTIFFSSPNVITELNKWYHVAVTYKPDLVTAQDFPRAEVKFYVDGTEYDTNSPSAFNHRDRFFDHPVAAATGADLRFGGNPSPSDDAFDSDLINHNLAYLQGSLANVLLYIHGINNDGTVVEPLNVQQINEIKDLGLLFCGSGITHLPRFSEATGYWRMNENDSSFGRVKNNTTNSDIFGSSFGGITQEATEAEDKFGYFYKTTQADKFNFTKSNGFGIDIVDVDSGQTTTADAIFITSSRWPLDARSDFSAFPLDLLTSSFNNSAAGEGCFSFQATSHGTRGEGILQNDYSIFSCGANFQHGTPPVAPVYSRRTPQGYVDHYIGTVTITDNSKLASGDKVSFTTLDGTTITATADSSTTTVIDTDSPTFALSQLATLSEQNEQTAIRLKNCLNANSKITATMSNSISNTVEIKIVANALTLANKTITLTDASDAGMSKTDFAGVITKEYLAGEAEWKVGSQLGTNPFDTDFEAHAENFRQLGQDHSLVPEFIISDHIEDVTLNANGDFTDLVNRDSFLSVNGAVYNASSGEVSINSRFYKTYGISDMMKYFGVTLEEIEDNELGDPLKITLRCKAAIKFTPYRGFYPVERVQQITEMFSRGYMSEFEFESVPDTAIPPFIKDQETLLKTKIRANMQQSMKPLFAPGVLMNSIKSGMAVDYPLFTAENASIQITSGSNNEGYKTLVISDRDGVTIPASSKAANGDYFAAANFKQPRVHQGRVHLYKKSLTPSTGVEEFHAVNTLVSPVSPDPVDGEHFGISTSIDGDFLTVGNIAGRAKLDLIIPGQDLTNETALYGIDPPTHGSLMINATGSIYVYQKSGDNFDQLISTIKDPDDARYNCADWDKPGDTHTTNCTIAVGQVIENEGFGRTVLIKNPYIFTSARVVKRALGDADSTIANCVYVYRSGYQGSFIDGVPNVDGFASIDGTRDLLQRVMPSTDDREILSRFACDNKTTINEVRKPSRLFDYSNNILVVSAPAKDPFERPDGVFPIPTLSTVDGHVFVFSIDPATGRFAERQIITPPSGYVQARGSDFGRAISLSSDASTLVIGQPQFTVSTNTGTRQFNGVVHIYEYGTDNNYSYKQSLSIPTPSDTPTGDLFGSSVDIDGSYIVVSALRDEDNREFVFKKGTDGIWRFADELFQDISAEARAKDVNGKLLFTGGGSIIHGGKIFAGTRQFPEENTKELMFISDIIEDTVDNYDTIKRQVISPSKQFNKAVENINNFVGSKVNNTQDSGVPRLKGNAYKRVTFEEMLNPDFLEGLTIEDQEPHPSASIYYADKYSGKVMDFPFKFGQLDITNNEIDLGVSEFSLKKSLSESLKPYRLAVNNFCAETINFFLEEGRTATLETQENVFPLLEKNEDYKMRIEVVNSNTRMYDRHSAFGPPVDEGQVKLLSNKEFVVFEDQHAYSPFVPPFLDPGSSPYVDITFTPTETRNYTLSEIIDGAQYDYRNFSTIPENSSTNSNYLNAMSLEASLKLDSFVVYQPTTSDAGSTIEQRSRWVIQPRWETPVLNFIESEGSALNLNDNKLDDAVSGRISPWQKRIWDNFYVSRPISSTVPYLTSSIGMWHQAGKLPKSDKEGYTIRIAPHPEVTKPRNQLADAVGFTNKNSLTAQVGRLRKRKVVYEAVVAIPFIEPENSNQNITYFELDDTYYDTALNLNRKIEDRFERSLLNLEKTSAEYQTAVEEYERIYNTPGQRPDEVIAYQLRMQDKYVIPEEFRNKMMYVFQFSAEFTKNDLANIWQNVSPTSDFSGKELRYSTVDNSQGISGHAQDVQYISNFLNDLSPSSRAMDFKNNKIRWIVLKVKQRAEIDLNRVKRNSLEGPASLDRLVIDNTRGSFSGTPELRNQKHSFNWPYDFFSIVELVKLEGKVDIFDTVPTITDALPYGEE